MREKHAADPPADGGRKDPQVLEFGAPAFDADRDEARDPPPQQRHRDGMAAQVRQALLNTLAVLGEAGAGPEHVVRMTWYVRGVEAYTAALPEIGAAWRGVMGRHYPPMAVVEVVRLVEPAALVEIETTAVVPSSPGPA